MADTRDGPHLDSQASPIQCLDGSSPSQYNSAVVSQHDNQASRRVSTSNSSKSSKSLSRIDCFDANALDIAYWGDIGDIDNTGMEGDFTDFSSFGLLNSSFETTQFNPRASFNLLQNPFSALPGLVTTNTGNSFIDPQLYDFTPPTFNQLQQVGLSGVSTIFEVVPSPSRRSPRNKTPVCNTFSDATMPENPIYEYPMPTDHLSLANMPYYTGTGQAKPDDDSLFILGSPVSIQSRRHSITPDTSHEHGRTSDTHSSARSRSSLSNSGVNAAQETQHTHPHKSGFEHGFKYEKPKVDVEKPWVRTNATTKGLTTRTAKLNDYDPSKFYVNTPNPLGTWHTRDNIFEYANMGELREQTYTADQIRDFILQYPEDKAKKIQLQLFIQIGPTDSARRYLSSTWSKCRFRDCPVQRHENGTIRHGHYRVAFDERSYGTNNRYDPHLAASAYVHLYCLERFLDFEYICRKAHVRVDNRQYTTEPKGKFAATLAGRPECGIAEDFVKYAARGTLRTSVPEFANYPVHSQYRNGEPKPHSSTLTAVLHSVKASTRPPAQLKQFEDRGLKVSNVIVSKGDLDLIMKEKLRKKDKARVEKAKQRQKRKHYDVDSSSDNNEDVNYSTRRHRLVAEAKKALASTSRRHAPARRRRKSPVSPQSTEPYPWEKDDNESSDDNDHHSLQAEHSQPPRRSSRATRKPVNHAEETAEPLDAPIGYRPAESLDLASSNPRRHSSLPKFYDPDLAGIDFDALMNAEGFDPPLNRRTSSHPFLRLGSHAGSDSRMTSDSRDRHASFAEQPVTQPQIFEGDASLHGVDARASNTDIASQCRVTRRQSRKAMTAASRHGVQDARVEKRGSRVGKR